MRDHTSRGEKERAFKAHRVCAVYIFEFGACSHKKDYDLLCDKHLCTVLALLVESPFSQRNSLLFFRSFVRVMNLYVIYMGEITWT